MKKKIRFSVESRYEGKQTYQVKNLDEFLFLMKHDYTVDMGDAFDAHLNEEYRSVVLDEEHPSADVLFMYDKERYDWMFEEFMNEKLKKTWDSLQEYSWKKIAGLRLEREDE